MANALGSPIVKSGGPTIPQIYSLKVLPFLYASTNLPHMADCNYGTELKQFGDLYKIDALPEDIEIKAYTPDMKLNFQNLDWIEKEFRCDKGAYYGWQFSEITKKKCGKNFKEIMGAHLQKFFGIYIEKEFNANVFTEADDANQGIAAGAESKKVNLGSAAAPLGLDVSNVVMWFTGITQVLKENNVDSLKTKIALSIPPWIFSLLKQSDYGKANIVDNGVSPLITGVLPVLEKVDLVQSNLLSQFETTVGADTVNAWNVFANSPSDVSFVPQILMPHEEVLPGTGGVMNTLSFIEIWGYKVWEPKSMLHSVVYPK